MKRLLATGMMLAISGCTSPDAVRGMSVRLSSASATWDDVGNDIYASCRRESDINPVLVDCTIEKDASAGLVDVDAVLANYFKALTDAANTSNFTIQPGLDKAAASAAKIPGIDTGQLKAVSGLAGLLAKIATGALREATLRKLIEEGGPSAQTVIRGMDGLVGPRLARELDAEHLQLAGHFGRLILAQRDAAGPDLAMLCSGSAASRFSGTGYLLTLEYCRRLAILDKRTKALADYRASLALADAAMTALQSSQSKLKTAALARQLYAIGTDLDRQVTMIRQAFE